MKCSLWPKTAAVQTCSINLFALAMLRTCPALGALPLGSMHCCVWNTFVCSENGMSDRVWRSYWHKHQMFFFLLLFFSAGNNYVQNGGEDFTS